MTKPNAPVNVLTKEIITGFFESLRDGSKVSRVRFDEDDLGRFLVTMYGLNALSVDDSMFNGTPLKEWKIPSAFNGMLFKEITLSGEDNQQPLILWEVDEEVSSLYEPFDDADMIVFSRKFYAGYRANVEFTDVADEKGVRGKISDYVSHMILNDERVVECFESGNFPLRTAVPFFKEYAEGLKIKRAQEMYIHDVIIGIK